MFSDPNDCYIPEREVECEVEIRLRKKVKVVTTDYALREDVQDYLADEFESGKMKTTKDFPNRSFKFFLLTMKRKRILASCRYPTGGS